MPYFKSLFFRSLCVVLLVLAVTPFITASYIATNPLKGCSVDATNQLTCPGGFSTGGAPGGPLVMTGATSGTTTIVSPAVAGTPTLTWPTVTGTLVETTGGSPMTTVTPAANAIPQAGTDSRLAPGFLQQIGGGYLPLSGAVFKRAYSGNTPLGTTDVYTAPALKRAYVATVQAFNPTAGAIVYSASLKSAGTYYRLIANATANTVAFSVSTSFPYIVLEPGESISVVTDVAGLNVWFRVIEYDSSVPMYSPRLLTTSTGDNTLYTVPVGKSAIVLGGPGNLGSIGAISHSNVSGSTRTLKYYVVSSGGTTGTTNQAIGVALATGNAGQSTAFGSMATGDFIVFNTDLGGSQVVWTVVVEY